MRLLMAFAASMLASCQVGGNNQAVQECARRGVEYFKEAGSYPTLKSQPNGGRSAEDVALERCRRTTTAF
jgi:hypothetical protein